MAMGDGACTQKKGRTNVRPSEKCDIEKNQLIGTGDPLRALLSSGLRAPVLLKFA